MSELTKKLYRVTLKGMTFSTNATVYGISYVVATNSHEAYLKVKESMDKKDLGYTKDRELDKVELIAEDYQYTSAGYILYL